MGVSGVPTPRTVNTKSCLAGQGRRLDSLKFWFVIALLQVSGEEEHTWIPSNLRLCKLARTGLPATRGCRANIISAGSSLRISIFSVSPWTATIPSTLHQMLDNKTTMADYQALSNTNIAKLRSSLAAVNRHQPPYSCWLFDINTQILLDHLRTW